MTQPRILMKRTGGGRYRRAAARHVCTVLAAAVAGCGVWYAVFGSAFFSMRHFEISGAERVLAADVRAAAETALDGMLFLGLLPKRNYFLVSPDAVSKEISSRFMLLDRVAVRKIFPETLRIEVYERRYAGVWCSGHAVVPQGEADAQCFLIDESGVAYAAAPMSSGTLLLALTSDEIRGVGEAVIDAQTLRNLSLLRDSLRARHGFAVTSFDTRKLPDATAFLAEGLELRFDASRPPEETLSLFTKTLSAIGEKARDVAYIDLRIENRAYYALRKNAGVRKE